MSGFIQHGGALDRAIAQYGGVPEEWLDLSTGINPRAYPVADLPPTIWHNLPQEKDLNQCLEAARSYYTVPEMAGIVAAPGTQAIIQWLPHLWPGRDAVVVTPAYGEYDQVFRLAGRQVSKVGDVQTTNPVDKVVFLGNPNNPDGRIWRKDECEKLLERGACLVIDEAFGDVAAETSLTDLAAMDNVLILKSFGKFFGLAGVRLGIAIGQVALVDRLRLLLGPWSVPGPALVLGVSAFADEQWAIETRDWLSAKRHALELMLVDAGFDVVGGTDLFVTVAHSRAAAIHEGLARQKILVRPFDYAPSWLRFGVPAGDAALARLAKALGRSLY
ncbi:MAG: threonine-phosphate decarboxylase CobD [Pseudomonadota bacterium]